LRAIVLFLFALSAAAYADSAKKPADARYQPLWAHQGAWLVARAGNGVKPYRLVNDCALVGIYFVCQQSVDGKPGGLLIVIPADSPGHYYTQTIMPEGRATGRDDLEISGNQWTFTSRRLEYGKSKYYRTVNTFTDRNTIHFEQAQSTDGDHWTVTGSGDEARSKAPHR
jgi:hypothetical protein